MEDANYSIDGSMVTENEFFKKKMNQLNVAGINHIIEPYLAEINLQHGRIEYKNNVGISSVTVHNVSPELLSRIQGEMDQNIFH